MGARKLPYDMAATASSSFSTIQHKGFPREHGTVTPSPYRR